MQRKWFVIGILVLGALTLAMGLTYAQAQQPLDGEAHPQSNLSIAAMVESKINYQGRLEQNGQPVSGSQDMLFRLYSDDTCLTQVGSDMIQNGVQMTDGLFSVELPVTHSDFTGQGIWLSVRIGPTTWVGCQEILPVPYALSLQPGAIISGTKTYVEMNRFEPGSGIVLSADYGIYAKANGAQTGYGVYGENSSPFGAGVAGRATTASGWGVYGYNSAGGYAGYFSGNVGQGRADDGLVKAAVKVSCSGAESSIEYAFKNLPGNPIALGSATGDGQCQIDFNFDLSDRYFSAVAVYASPSVRGVNCAPLASPNDTMNCFRWNADGNGVDGHIMIVIY